MSFLIKNVKLKTGFSITDKKRTLKQRPGIVLIMAIVLLAAMMMIGTALLLSTNMEIQHSGLLRRNQALFFDTDAMSNVAYNVAKLTISSDFDGINDYLAATGTFRVELLDEGFYIEDPDEDTINKFDIGQADMAFWIRGGERPNRLAALVDVDTVKITGSITGGNESGNDGGSITSRAFLIRALGFNNPDNLAQSQLERIVVFFQEVLY